MEAFRPGTIDQQMDAQFQNFLANKKKGMLSYYTSDWLEGTVPTVICPLVPKSF